MALTLKSTPALRDAPTLGLFPVRPFPLGLTLRQRRRGRRQHATLRAYCGRLLDFELVLDKPEQNAAMQIANGNWHDDSKLQATFKAADLRKTGTVSYPTFVQCLNYVGVAMPAKDAAALARQLDPNGTGQVNYSLLPSHLNQALEMRKQFELEETSRRRGILFFFCPVLSLCDLL